MPTFCWVRRGDDFVLADFNEAALRFTEGRIGMLLGRPAAEVFAEGPEIREDIRRCADEQHVLKREIWHTLKTTGERRLVNNTYAFVPPDAVLIHVEDLTERRQTEEALARSERRYRTLMENASDGINVTDEDGVIREVNARYCEILGRPSTEIIGRRLTDFVHPEDLAAAARVLTVLRSGSRQLVERRLCRPDGSYVPVEVSAREVEPGRILSIVRDITERKKAEAGLRAVEARLHHVISSAPLIVWAIDGQGMITLIEGSGLEAVGFTKEDLLGRTVAEASSDPQAAERQERVLRGEVIHTTRVIRGRTLEIHYFPQRDEEGEVTGATGLALDVTERSRAEVALQAVERRLQRLLSSAPVILWAIDLEGVFTLSEGLGLRALGLSPGQAVGLNARDLYGDVPEAIPNLERALHGETFTAVVAFRDLSFEIQYFPERDEHGRIVGASGIAFDVTERSRTEQEVRESEERFRQFAENVREAFWMASPDLKRMLYTSPAYQEIYGLSATDVKTGSEWLDVVHPDDRSRVRNIVSQWPREGPVEAIYRVVRKDGSVSWIRDRAFPVRDAAGHVLRVAGVAEDVTESRRVEAEVRRIQGRLADAQRIAHMGNWDWEIVTDEIWLSEEAHRILGVGDAGESMTFRSFLSAIHPEDRLGVQEAINATHAHGTTLLAAHRVPRPDGSIRIVQESGEVTFDASGRPVRMIGTVQDVTETEEAAKALAVLTSAVEQTADLVFITDHEGRLEFVNPAFEQHTGYTRAEALGRTPRILKSGQMSPEFAAHLWQTVLGGQTFRGVFVNRKKNGEIFYEEKTITPIRDGQGRITHFVSTGRDITERRRTEEVQTRLQEAVLKSAEEWKATFDAVQSPLFLLDAQGLVKRLNRAARDLWELPFEDLVGHPLMAREGEPWDGMVRAVEAVRQARAAVSLTVEDPLARRTWDIAASPLREPQGEASVIVLVRDISSIVELQESLRRSERMSAMGALVAGVAHEVRNPLFGISAALDAFESDFGAREDFRDYSTLLRSEVGRLNDLMQDLLEYGRPSPAQFSLGPLAEVIDRALRSCAPLARSKDVVLARETDEGLPPLQMEPSRLVQVFQNLIENAIQHSPGGKTVTVGAQRIRKGNEAGIECTVEDEGPGFRQEDLTKVFEPFFTRRRGGTGLGLSIVQRIVEEHGGAIRADNRREGGAIVTVTLPAREGESLDA